MDGTPDDNFALSSIFSQSYFVIPKYQRDYAWEESHVEDLLEDLDFIFQKNDSDSANERHTHYFGTIVLEERGTIEPTNFEDYEVFGIVDGQQRLATVAIIISGIIDEMAEIANSDEVDEDIEVKIIDRKDDIENKYIEYEGIERVQLGGLAKQAYKEVVTKEESPVKYLKRDDLVDAERKVARAQITVINKLHEWRDERFKDESIDHSSYYKFLNELIRILTQRFEVNVKVVEDVDEAARMFKVINDRGRDLRLHDKVRSHLVYCASQSDVMSAEEIYKQFNRIVENITIHDGFSDSEVDDLIRIHWEVFTSERSDSRAKRRGPSEIHRRLSSVDNFAYIQRDDYDSFINPYMTSLVNFSERYPYLTNREKFVSEYLESGGKNTDPNLQEGLQKVQVFFMHSGVQSATAPILIAAAEVFGVRSEEFVELVSSMEKLVYRFSLVMSHGAQGYVNTFSSLANDLYWSTIDDSKVEVIFNSESGRFCGHQSKELGIRDCIERIEEKSDRIAPIDEVISEYLSEPDVLDGSLTSGWGGVRNSEVIKYMMYEYERSLRGTSGLLSLSPYYEFRENFEVEHLVPKNAEEGHKLPSHTQNRNRIGNLAVLSSAENKSKGNSSFKNKYEDIYSKSSLNILRNLEGPDFSLQEITNREEEELFPFIKERWG